MGGSAIAGQKLTLMRFIILGIVSPHGQVAFHLWQFWHFEITCRLSRSSGEWEVAYLAPSSSCIFCMKPVLRHHHKRLETTNIKLTSFIHSDT